MNAPLYTIEVLRLAASLPDDVPLAACDGLAEARSPTCGSRIATRVKLASDGRIGQLSQSVNACAFGQASAALIARHAAGRDLASVEASVDAVSAWLQNAAAAAPDWPEIDAIAPVRSWRSRHGAVLLPFQALAAAMRDATR